MIACVMFPHLPVATQFRDGLATRRKPLLLHDERTGTIAARCAKSITIPVGTPYSRAVMLMPNAQFRSYPADTIKAVQEELFWILRDFSDQIEVESQPDELSYFLDLGRLQAKDGLKLARKMRRVVKQQIGIEAQVGLAKGMFAARIAAFYTERYRLIHPSNELSEIAGLPVDWLPLDRESLRRLHLFGIRTIGAFSRLPKYAVQAQFGKEAMTAHQLSHGIDHRTLKPRIPEYTQTIDIAFDDPVIDCQQLTQAIQHKAKQTFKSLSRSGYVVTRLDFLFTLEGEHLVSHHRQPRQNIDRSDELVRVIDVAIENTTFTAPINACQIKLTCKLPTKPVQLPMFTEKDLPDHNLRLIAEYVSEHHGSEIICNYRPVDKDAPLPEQRFERVS